MVRMRSRVQVPKTAPFVGENKVCPDENWGNFLYGNLELGFVVFWLQEGLAEYFNKGIWENYVFRVFFKMWGYLVRSISGDAASDFCDEKSELWAVFGKYEKSVYGWQENLVSTSLLSNLVLIIGQSFIS